MLGLGAPVPHRLQNASFVAKPLTTDLATADYASYMASPDVIRVHSDGRWPIDGFTLQQNLKQAAKLSRRAAHERVDPHRAHSVCP